MRIMCYLLGVVFLVSCSTPSDPSISDCWLLFSVESLDLPDSNPNKITYYSQTLRESNSPVIGKDGDYQKWTWEDSLTIEYSINLNGEKYSEVDKFSYQVLNDTIIHMDSTQIVKRGIQIFDGQLILTGYTDSQLYGLKNYQYVYNLIE